MATVTAVLITKRPLKILHAEAFGHESSAENPLARFEQYRSEMTQWARDTDRTADLMRLALLLASPKEGFFAAQRGSTTVLDPLQSIPAMQWPSAQTFAPSPMAGLGADALVRVHEWAQRTKDHPKRLDIAMRRTLTAVTERTDLLDGFIDAVLAWENMFSGRPETNLRVCGAIAWLLEPDDYGRRNALFGELKDLYTKRSNLVHGTAETVPDVLACRDRAARISLDSIRRLYGDDRLLRVKDSAERGGMILMGVAQARQLISRRTGFLTGRNRRTPRSRGSGFLRSKCWDSRRSSCRRPPPHQCPPDRGRVPATYPPAGSPQPHAVASQTVPGAGTTTYAYDAAGHATSVTAPSQSQSLSWDDAGRLSSVTATPAGTSSPATTSYLYDAGGNLLIQSGPGAITSTSATSNSP
jgi:YD repeat-containing protein